MVKKVAIIENNIIATNTIREKLTRAIMHAGYEVTILTTGTPEDMELATQKGFSIINVKGSTQDPRDIAKYMRNLSKALKKINAEVCLTFTIRPAIWGNMVTSRLRIPTLTNITGIGPLFERSNAAYRAARMLYKFVLKKTQLIFFQNDDDMQIFLQKGFVTKERAVKIPGSGVDYEYYKPIAKKSGNDSLVFLFISRLVKDKGIVEYVQAAEILKKEFPNIECRVLGPLWLQNLKDNTVTQQELEGWQSEGIIKYLGDTKDVRPFIADADCVVLPSYREGTSNVLLEACSMEKPCITCNTTGCKEIVEDNVTGYLCKVKDAEGLASKMKKMAMLTEQERIDMGKKGRQKVIKEFDKKIVIDAYLNAIKNIKLKK